MSVITKPGVTGVLLCVDVTESVIDEALSLDANLVVSHHPLLFHPLRQLVDADFTQRIVRRALLAGISLYAAHTNLDSAAGGMSFRLGKLLGLTGMRVLSPHRDGAETGFGVVGDLPEAIPVSGFYNRLSRCSAVGRSVIPSCAGSRCGGWRW